jgi:S-adenosylmethionine hydrolase
VKTLVSLLTDFGLSDPFVGEVKATIFSICPEAEVIDITHDVERFNVRMGAFLLATATPFFPAGSVHVAVVDPGVGSERRPIAVQTSRSVYVGPDNGLLLPAATREGIQHVYELTNVALMRDTISSTFHGRDIFAPVAAHLACGTQPKEVGDEIMNYERLAFREPKFDRRGITCEAIHIDHFGNIVTNISQLNMGKLNSNPRAVITIRGKRSRVRLVKAYSNINKNELGLVFGSHGFLEITAREDNVSRRLKAKAGDAIRLSFP